MYIFLENFHFIEVFDNICVVARSTLMLLKIFFFLEVIFSSFSL